MRLKSLTRSNTSRPPIRGETRRVSVQLTSTSLSIYGASTSRRCRQHSGTQSPIPGSWDTHTSGSTRSVSLKATMATSDTRPGGWRTCSAKPTACLRRALRSARGTAFRGPDAAGGSSTSGRSWAGSSGRRTNVLSPWEGGRAAGARHAGDEECRQHRGAERRRAGVHPVGDGGRRGGRCLMFLRPLPPPTLLPCPGAARPSSRRRPVRLLV